MHGNNQTQSIQRSSTRHPQRAQSKVNRVGGHAGRTLQNCALCEPLTHDAARVSSLEISIKDFNGL